jgi:hypothetical protein
MKPDQSLQDFIQQQLAVVELPTAARDRLINELFSEINKKGIDGWAYLANCLFYAIARHYGEAAARSIFNGSGPPPKRLLSALRNAAVLDRLDAMKPTPNVSKLARELAEENKALPKQRQRGAGGTDVQVLEDHIRDLVKARKEHLAARKA